MVRVMNVWNPWVPVIGDFLLPGCNAAGLLFGLLGLIFACRPDQ